MKIYQIHEYGGEWEDSYDYIVSSYLSEEKAIAEKERLENEVLELSKCNTCILYFCPDDCSMKCDSKECKDYAIAEAKKCKDYKSDGAGCCKNFRQKFDVSSFRIEEVEVIE